MTAIKKSKYPIILRPVHITKLEDLEIERKLIRNKIEEDNYRARFGTTRPILVDRLNKNEISQLKWHERIMYRIPNWINCNPNFLVQLAKWALRLIMVKFL